ncbi:MAG TPA: EamA family transporter [Burkholderiaceae bacterium]|nr:EamA family transporter [Burkholderiaceae bacterium]
MPARHILLALLVVAVWGTNFVVIKVALAKLPPLLFGAMRFGFAFFPAALLLPRPRVAWSNLAAYGLFIGVGQFGLLYLAMRSDISPGLASLVIQTQVFMTIGLSALLLKQRVRAYQVLALVVAVGGIVVIALHTEGSTTPLGLAMVLAAAASWSAGNLAGIRAGRVNVVAYVVWSSPFAALALAALSLGFEGGPAVRRALDGADAATWAAVFWQSAGNSLFGYAAWSWLLARHPASAVTPMALLVPVFGIAASSMLLGESLPGWKLAAIALVIGGLAVNLMWPALAQLASRRSTSRSNSSGRIG